MPDQAVAGLNTAEVMQFLLDHLQNANLRLSGAAGETAPSRTLNGNQAFWSQFLHAPARSWTWVKLERFRVVDWQPRTAGL